MPTMFSSSNGSQLVRKSASGDASQLTGSSDGTVSMFRIGSYNVGVDQSKLTSENAKAVLDKVENIITTCVKDFGLDIMNLCEFGGHLQGLSDAGISAKDMNIFNGPQATSVSVNSNYLTSWGFNADTTQFYVKQKKLSGWGATPHAGKTNAGQSWWCTNSRTTLEFDSCLAI